MSDQKQSLFKKTMSDKGSKKYLLFVSTAIIGIVGYIAFFSGGSSDSALESRLNNAPSVKDDTLAGQLDPAYKEAIQQEDGQRAQQAIKNGQSSTPTLLGNKVENQEPIEIKIDPPKPEIVRPEVAVKKPVRPVVIPEPDPEPVAVTPVIERPRPQIVEAPVNIPVASPGQQQVQLVERPSPQTNGELLNAYSRQMGQILAHMERVPGSPQTTYFYQPPEPENEGDPYAGGDVYVPENVVDNALVETDLSLNSQQTVSASAAGLEDGSDLPFDFPLAGEILYGQMVTTADSDAPGPVVAQILQGELAGARVIGSFSVANEKLVLEFTSMTVSETIGGERIEDTFPIQAVAVDTEHVGTGVASSVNRRMAQRIAVTFATSFVKGLGEAIASSGTTSETTDAGTTVTSTPTLSTDDQMKVAAGAAAAEVGTVINDFYGSRGVTVKMEAGTPMGILFLQE